MWDLSDCPHSSSETERQLEGCLGNSPGVQWLGLHGFTADGTGLVEALVPSRGTNIPAKWVQCGAAKRDRRVLQHQYQGHGQ